MKQNDVQGVGALRRLALSVLLTCGAGSAITADLMSQKPASDATVTFTNSGVSPSTISVKSGAKITWVNGETQSHSLSIAGSEPQRLYAKSRFETSFSQAGNYSFECKTHRQKGTILVTGPAVTPPKAATPVASSHQHDHSAMAAAPAHTTSAHSAKPAAATSGSTVKMVSEMNGQSLKMYFTPQRLVVKAGTAVTFSNEDYSNHIVKIGNIESERLHRGASFSHSFDQPGEYPYICKIHGERMSGVIVVE